MTIFSACSLLIETEMYIIFASFFSEVFYLNLSEVWGHAQACLSASMEDEKAKCLQLLCHQKWYIQQTLPGFQTFVIMSAKQQQVIIFVFLCKT